MWARRTFHQCAEELRTISEDFRAAYLNGSGWEAPRRNRVMQETSRTGVELLRILAVSIRSEQDYGRTEYDGTPVGALVLNATPEEVTTTLREYRPPYSEIIGSTPLHLREALNKIVHAQPARNGFFVDNDTHDLILSGQSQGNVRTWIAVISLIDLCRVVKSLPDANTHA